MKWIGRIALAGLMVAIGAGLFQYGFMLTDPASQPTPRQKCDAFMARMGNTKIGDMTPNDVKTIASCAALDDSK
jgi:hypothetical protein